jgi:hypothetical protein
VRKLEDNIKADIPNRHYAILHEYYYSVLQGKTHATVEMQVALRGWMSPAGLPTQTATFRVRF